MVFILLSSNSAWYKRSAHICKKHFKDACSLKEKLWQTSVQFSSVTQLCPTLWDPMDCSMPGKPRQYIKKQRHYLANRGPDNQSYSFSNSPVWMWELEHKQGWVSKNWCFWTVMLEKTLESPLGCKEIKLVNPKGNQTWIFIGRTDAVAEAPILWPPDTKSWLIGKDPDAGKDWRQEEKGMTEDEMVGWHHRLNGHEFE